MKVFLSAIENAQASGAKGRSVAELIVEKGIKMKYNLMSFYYMKNKEKLAEYIRDHTEEIMIDSGAHSFQKGKKVDWDKYTQAYANFIKKFDRDNVVGYFEMDVDNIIGYEKVLQLRKELEKVSNKIIPVWHKNRGIAEFKKMCQDYKGRVVAITGFKNEDIKDEQYLMFLKYAKAYGCKVHCLGMTRKKVLDKVPFDYVDSSSWVQSTVFGRAKGKKVSKETSRYNREAVFIENYKEGLEMQKYYYQKWRSECQD